METKTISCQCGQVVMTATGAPIVRVQCYCHSCQEGGARLEALPGAPPVREADGGTDYVLYRKDRVACMQGGDKLVELKLKPTSPTRRLAASCCNTAMFLDVSKAHWVTFYRHRLADPVPPLALRSMTAERREGVTLPDDGVPAYPGRSGKFFGKLLGAWLAMGFRIPAVKGVPAHPPRLA